MFLYEAQISGERLQDDWSSGFSLLPVFGFRGSVKFQFMLVHIISSPEPLGSQGELIVYLSSRSTSVRRRPSTISKDLLRNHFATQSQILC